MTAYWWDKDKNAVAISYKDNRLILTVDDAQALLRQLEMLLPERPSRDEPEEPGFYRTRTGAFLRKNKNGAWSALFINGDLIPRYWNDQDDYAKWRTVLECLYPRAFPLSVFIVITLGVIAILCVLMLLGVFVCIFDHDDNHRNDKSSKE